MATIAFDKVRGDMPNGQRGAFEELVCQLARRQASAPISFRRIDGTGGDGGVECIHRDSSGGIIGYQAKYYTRAGEINWTAVDRSVKTALSTYPDLVTYVIAIACDFTGRRRIRGGVISGGAWGEWESHVEEWQREAAKGGRRVEFIPWTAHELRSFLMTGETAGLRAYWFGETEFSNHWFKTRVELAVAALDERYNADDHVDVSIQSLFDCIIRHAHTREKLEHQFRAIERLSFPQHRLQSIRPKPPDELIEESGTALHRLIAIKSELMLPLWSPWPTGNWNCLTNDAASKIGRLRSWARATLLELERQRDKTARRDFDLVFHELGGLYSEIHTLNSLLKETYFVAEQRRAALITGRAGTGKSHLFARVAELAVSENRPIILLLGQQLRDQPLWPQILDRLELRDVSPEAFLGALDAAAESQRVRGLILCDAINEGPGAHLWRNEIASFLAQVEQYPNLACVLSCRSEYVDYLVPLAVLDTLPQFEVRGFEAPEEQAHAARVYLDKRGISRPATPWLAPEFVNPLFLRSCCNALKQEGQTEFPRGLTGAKQIFAFFIESVGSHLGAGRDGTRDLLRPCKTTLLEIAFEMAEGRKDHIARGRAEEIAEQVFKPFISPSGLSWLEILQRNGLLRFDPDPAVNPGDPLHQPPDVVRFSFQRLQDHLMSEALLDKVSDVKAALAPGGPLSFIHDGKRIGWKWRGLLAALSIQSPEKFGIEILDALRGDAVAWLGAREVQSAFEESVRWRAVTAFTKRTLDILNRLGFHSERLSLLIDLLTSIDHPWNAEFIHRNLITKTMAERDSFWSIEINRIDDVDSHGLLRLIDWCLHTRGIGAVRKTLWLCALTLAWCFTSSNRAVRDGATKALTGLLLTEPDIFPELVDAFGNVNDLYICERLYGAGYGACCIDPSYERVKLYAEVTFRQFSVKGHRPVTFFSGITQEVLLNLPTKRVPFIKRSILNDADLLMPRLYQGSKSLRRL